MNAVAASFGNLISKTNAVLPIRLGTVFVSVFVPLGMIFYVRYFTDQKLIFKNFLFHEVVVLFAILWGFLISFIAYQCYLSKRETFLRYMTLAFLGQVIVYSLHGMLTRTADWIPILFILYGPVSRVVLALLLSVALLTYGKDNIDRLDKRHWTIWTIAIAFILPAVALLAISPIGTNFYVRAGFETLSIAMYLCSIAVIIYRRINTPLMFLYVISLIFFIQSSFTFILVQMAWNHLFWLAHIFFASGFFVINCGLIRAYQTSTSFTEIFNEDLLSVRLSEQLIELRTEVEMRKKAEKVLGESEGRFRSVIDNSPSFINLKGTDGRFQLFNRKHSEVFDVEDSIGKTSSDIHSKEVAEEIFIQEQKVIESKSTVTKERHFLTNQGTRDFLVTKFPILDESGAVMGIGTIGTDITERKQAEDQIKASLVEKDVLLKEIHHRVKNNLQVISSMLWIQADAEDNAHTVEVLQGSHRRIMLMARIHESLYRQDDLSVINAGEFLNALVTETKASGGKVFEHLSFHIDVDDISLDVDHANTYGQIVSELISNCQKHGFANGQPGNIEVSLHKRDDGVTELTVADDGKGLPEDFDFEQADTLGLHLVRSLVTKLGGEFKINGTGGTRIQINFPEQPS